LTVAEPLLRVDNLVRRFGGIVATDHVCLDVARGELHAIIGPNGAGKTTLISQLTGHLAPHATFPACRRGAAARSGWRVRSRSPRCCRISPRPTMSRSRRKPMTDTRSASGAMRARKLLCARRRRRRSNASASRVAPTCWSRD
jgi:ABC-type glutathione transport system ATPase component